MAWVREMVGGEDPERGESACFLGLEGEGRDWISFYSVLF